MKVPKVMRKGTWMEERDDLYICVEHFEDESEVTTHGKRKRLRSDIGFPLTEEDLMIEEFSFDDDISEMSDEGEDENNLPVKDLGDGDMGTDLGDLEEILTQSEASIIEDIGGLETGQSLSQVLPSQVIAHTYALSSVFSDTHWKSSFIILAPSIYHLSLSS